MKLIPCLLTLALIVPASPTVLASIEQDSNTITLQQVIKNVLDRHPQLRINNHEARAAAEHIKQSRQGTPFEVKVDLSNVAGTGVYTGAGGMETSLSLGKVLETSNKSARRGDVATQQAQVLTHEQEAKRLDVLAHAAEVFIHVVVDQHRLKIAQQQLVVLQQTLDVVNKRIAAGKSHIAERRRTNIEIGRAEMTLEHAEHELATSRLKLTASWGDKTVKFASAQANLFDLPPVKSFEYLASLLEKNPDLARLVTEEHLAAAQLKLAKSNTTPDLALSGGVRYFNDSSDTALLFSATLPLGNSSRARPRVAEKNWLYEREPLRYEQQSLALYVMLFETYQELLHARTAFNMLNERIVPESELAEQDYRNGYQSGRFSLMELNEAQQTLLSNRLEKVMVASKYHRFLIEIERLTGAAMRSGEPQ